MYQQQLFLVHRISKKHKLHRLILFYTDINSMKIIRTKHLCLKSGV